MEMNPLLVKDIVELGVTVVICTIFLTQQQRMFGYLEKMISTMAKLEKQLNNDYLKGKGLEIALILKIQDIRWSIQKRVIKYIRNNHIKENWAVINKEIDTFFDVKLIDFETDMHDIIDDITFKIIYGIFKNEFSETKKVLMNILADLKEDGAKENELYDKAIRIVEAHMQTIENELIAHIKELINQGTLCILFF